MAPAPGIAIPFFRRLAMPGPDRRLLVRVIVLPDRLEINYRADPTSRIRPKRCRSPGSNRPRGCDGPFSSPAPPPASRTMEVERTEPLILAHRDRSLLASGTCQRISPRRRRTRRPREPHARSIRMTLSLAFLDPTLIDAACAGTLPRGYGVTRLMDLPPRFADQWRALGLTRPVRSDRPPSPESCGSRPIASGVARTRDGPSVTLICPRFAFLPFRGCPTPLRTALRRFELRSLPAPRRRPRKRKNRRQRPRARSRPQGRNDPASDRISTPVCDNPPKSPPKSSAAESG